MNDEIEIFKTQDGSIGLYNKKIKEIYHSRYGAKTESFEKFIEPILFMRDRKSLRILDICYGIGYNTKTAIKYFKNIEAIDCIEIDKDLVMKSYEFEFDNDINKIIEENIKTPNLINFYIDDVRKIIRKLDKKYDIVFHDGFSPHIQPQVWSEELIKLISEKMETDSIYITYNHSKPILNALYKAGLIIGKVKKNGNLIGTIASFNSNLINDSLDDYEIKQLTTKSAITYKDNDLSLTNDEIIKNREKEVLNSDLETLSHLKKYYKKDITC